MELDKIFDKTKKILIEIIDNNSYNISMQSSAIDVAEWDSIVHIELIVALESEFNISFKSNEIGEFKNIGEICHSIYNKLKNKN